MKLNDISQQCLNNAKPLDFSHKEFLEKKFEQINNLISELSFNGLFFFSELYNYKISQIDDKIVFLGKDKMGRFLVSPFDILQREEIISIMQRDFYLKLVSEYQKHQYIKILKNYPYNMRAYFDDFDYMYKKSDLEFLPGRKYHKKRNLINLFMKTYTNYKTVFINKENIYDVTRVLEKIKAKNQMKTEDKDSDDLAITKVLQVYNLLNLMGRITYVNNDPVGFVIGEMRKENICCVIHFEKADQDIKGIYQFINQEFISNLSTECKVINREQDLGLLGLRQSKQTYRPSAMLKKYRLFKYE